MLRFLRRSAVFRALALVWVSLVACLLPAQAATRPAAALAGTGFRPIEVKDPVHGDSMPGVIFYPARVRTGVTVIGPYRVAATRNAPIAAGRFPLIVFSHGTGGSRWDIHDFETGLARRGFVVAAIDHPGDNFRDHSGEGSDTVLIGRELQISALVTAVLADRFAAPHLERSEIGAAGFSAGGYTALLLAGARPDFDLLHRYCRSYPKDPIFCTGWSVRLSRPPLTARRDPRIHAVFAMAPVGIYFNRAGLAGVHIPVFLVDGGGERVLPLAANFDRIRRDLPRPPRTLLIPGADHYVFLSPCTAAFRARNPSLCDDPAGVDRAAIHTQLVHDAAQFFHSALAESGKPGPAR